MMKFVFSLVFAFPLLTMAQNPDNKIGKKLGPNPVFILDSIQINKSEMLKLKPDTVSSLRLLTDTDAVKSFGTEAKDGVVIINTKSFNRKHYISYFRKKSPKYDSLYTAVKSDSTFQYIINDKVKEKNSEGDLATINDNLFISIEVLTANDLKNRFNILDREIGILIKCNKPKDIVNADKKF